MNQLAKRTIGAALVAASVLGIAVAPRVMADVITDQQIQAIRLRCTEIQAVLNRVHQGDTLLRYNRGPLYRALADKLMTPLNQRVATNQLNGGQLSRIAADYNEEYQKFVDAYKVYETELAAAIAIDCEKQPTGFYDQVANARGERERLHDANNKLVTLAKEFKAEALVLQKKVAQDE